MKRIKEIFDQNKGRYGVCRAHRELLNHGYRVNHKRVQRLMHSMGLLGKRPKEKYHSYKDEVGKIADHVIGHNQLPLFILFYCICPERICTVYYSLSMHITIDSQCYTVTLSGEEIKLYPKEFDVLHLLVQYHGLVFSHEQIYKVVWQEEAIECERVVYNVIYQLRKELKNPDMIQIVIGGEYKFVR